MSLLGGWVMKTMISKVSSIDAKMKYKQDAWETMMLSVETSACKMRISCCAWNWRRPIGGLCCWRNRIESWNQSLIGFWHLMKILGASWEINNAVHLNLEIWPYQSTRRHENLVQYVQGQCMLNWFMNHLTWGRPYSCTMTVYASTWGNALQALRGPDTDQQAADDQ